MGEARRRKLAGTYPEPGSSRSFLERFNSDAGTLTFQEAVEHAKQTKAGAYAFIPERHGPTIVGGTVWLIAYDSDHDTEPDEFEEVSVYFVHSLFGEDVAEDNWYSLEEAANEIQGLRFRATKLEPYKITFLDLAVALRMLEGQSRDDALASAGF
jgi:hypothetical protein